MYFIMAIVLGIYVICDFMSNILICHSFNYYEFNSHFFIDSHFITVIKVRTSMTSWKLLNIGGLEL